MKKFLSTVLALVMVLATFTMLVPTTSAAVADGSPTNKVVYSQDFDSLDFSDAKTSSVKADVLTAINWSENNNNSTATNPVEVIADPEQTGNYLLHVENNVNEACSYSVITDEALKNGFVITYEFKYVDAPVENDQYVGFNGAAGQNAAATWHAQYRYNGKFLNGYRGATGGWGNGANQKTFVVPASDWFTVRIEGNYEDGIKVWANKSRKADAPADHTTWSYNHEYTATNKKESKSLASFMLGQIHFACSSDINVYLDSLTVEATNYYTSGMPDFYGYQTSDNNIRLVGVIDNTVFTGASKIGYKVTLVKADGTTASLSKECNYVYSSITAWGSEPTTPSEMVSGASHIYALHITGITEAVTVRVTPYYVDKTTGNTVMGDASTFTFTPTA